MSITLSHLASAHTPSDSADVSLHCQGCSQIPGRATGSPALGFLGWLRPA